MTLTPRSTRWAALAAALTAMPLAAQEPAPAPALLLAPLAGQNIPVLPITLITVDSGSVAGLPSGRAARMAWADSIVGEALDARGPEVNWLLPPELRHRARRAPGLVSDPDRMGQAMLRANGLKRVPDPLASSLRSLVAISNARYVLVPASIRFIHTDDGIGAELSIVLADARSGSILWRSRPLAAAATAGEALAQTIAHILPDIH